MEAANVPSPSHNLTAQRREILAQVYALILSPDWQPEESEPTPQTDEANE